jgi:hypothetical protein
MNLDLLLRCLLAIHTVDLLVPPNHTSRRYHAYDLLTFYGTHSPE